MRVRVVDFARLARAAEVRFVLGLADFVVFFVVDFFVAITEVYYVISKKCIVLVFFGEFRIINLIVYAK